MNLQSYKLWYYLCDKCLWLCNNCTCLTLCSNQKCQTSAWYCSSHVMWVLWVVLEMNRVWCFQAKDDVESHPRLNAYPLLIISVSGWWLKQQLISLHIWSLLWELLRHLICRTLVDVVSATSFIRLWRTLHSLSATSRRCCNEMWKKSQAL